MFLAETGNLQVWWQWPAFISGRSKQRSGPEIAHLGQMAWPHVWLDRATEDRAEKVVAVNLVIEAVNHIMDHGLVKHIRQRDAVDNNGSVAPAIPAHVCAPVFARPLGLWHRHQIASQVSLYGLENTGRLTTPKAALLDIENTKPAAVACEPNFQIKHILSMYVFDEIRDLD
ncbi:hypothetical protein LPB79_02175 (plasmid) [Rhizobium sp. T136]|uniref:hypothetical protein n=1 Tax=Rhizobium sp. T136 TaxID=555319 RepID=UPI0004628ECD|nr:hypothetical protein [Rhizobium sp. T136]UFS80119.1 hypothetical protein LPB79_02175 [Rhizobium sp. T136]